MRKNALFLVLVLAGSIVLLGCTEKESADFWNQVLKDSVNGKTRIGLDFGDGEKTGPTPTPVCACTASYSTCRPNYDCYVPPGASCGQCVVSYEPTVTPTPTPTWKPGNCDCTEFATACAPDEECRFLKPESSCGKCVLKILKWPSPIPPECQCFVGANYCNAGESCTYPPDGGVCGRCLPEFTPTPTVTPSSTPTVTPSATASPTTATTTSSVTPPPLFEPTAQPTATVQPTPYCECAQGKPCLSGDFCENIDPTTGCGHCIFKLSTPTPPGYEPTALPTWQGGRKAIVFGHSGEDIEISKDNGKTWQPAKVGVPVSGNDRVKTGFQSKLAIRFETGEVVVLEELTEVQLRLFDLGAINQIELNIKAGGITSQHRPAAIRTEFKVTSPTSVTSVRGTVFYVGVDADGTTHVIVKEGRVQIQNTKTGQEQYVEAGTKATVTENTLEMPVLLTEKDEEKFTRLPTPTASATVKREKTQRPMSLLEKWWEQLLEWLGIQAGS